MHAHVSPMGWSPLVRMGWPSTCGLASWFASPLVPVAVGFLGGRSELQASPRALRPRNDTGGVSRARAQRDHDGLGVSVGMHRAGVKTQGGTSSLSR